MKIAPLVLIREERIKLALCCGPYDDEFWKFCDKFIKLPDSYSSIRSRFSAVFMVSNGWRGDKRLRTYVTTDSSMIDDLIWRLVGESNSEHHPHISQTLKRSEPLIKAWMLAGNSKFETSHTTI